MKQADMPILADYFKVSIPFEGDEKARFKAFLRASGRKAGPYLRLIALTGMESEQASRSPAS